VSADSVLGQLAALPRQAFVESDQPMA